MRITTRNVHIKWSGRNRNFEKFVNKTVERNAKMVNIMFAICPFVRLSSACRPTKIELLVYLVYLPSGNS